MFDGNEHKKTNGDSSQVIFSSNRQYLACLLAGGTLVLTGCGGGGGSSSGGGAPAPEFAAEVGGVGSKGILREAIVHAYELDLNGTRGSSIGSAETDVEGRFALTIGAGYEGGPVLFELTADADTRMLCDVPAGCGDVEFGDEVALDDGFALQTVSATVETGAVVRAQITPFTTMAASRVLAGEEVSSESINKANSEVSQILGVDVLTVEPVDLTDPDSDAPEAAIYSAYLAAVGALAFEDGGKGLNALVEDLASSFSDGRFDAQDGVKITDLIDSVEAVSGSIELFPKGAPSALTTAIELVKGAIGEDGSYDPEPSDAAGSPAIAQAKALLTQVRTLGSSVAELEQPLDAFELNIETAEAALSKNTVALLEVLPRSLDAVLTSLWGPEFPADGSAQTLDVFDDAGVKVATVRASATESAAGTSLTVDELVLLSGEPIELSVVFETNLKASDLAGAEPIAVSGIDFTAQGTISNTSTLVELEEIRLDVVLAESVSMDMDTFGDTEYELSTAEFAGSLSVTDKASGVVFAGAVGVELVGVDDANVAVADKSAASLRRASLEGSVADASNNAFDARIVLDLRNAATFDVFAFLGNEESEESEDYFASAVLTVSLQLALQGQPDTTATITLDRDAFDSGTAQLAFEEGGKSWSVSVDVTDGEEVSSLIVSNPDGVVVTLARDATADDEVSGDIKVDGAKVANIESDDNVVLVRWTDGTFETLY